MGGRSNLAICTQAQQNLDRLYEERNASQDEIARFEERIAVRNGEIAVAKNTLSSIRDAIANVADGVASVGADLATGNTGAAARDTIITAVRLANEEARQQQEISDLRSQLADEEWQLQSQRNKLSIIERDISQAVAFLDSNNCR